MGQAFDGNGNPLGRPELAESWLELVKKIDDQKLKDVQEIRMKKLHKKQFDEIEKLTEIEARNYLTQLLTLTKDEDETDNNNVPE